jgi:hypothetical protein
VAPETAPVTAARTRSQREPDAGGVDCEQGVVALIGSSRKVGVGWVAGRRVSRVDAVKGTPSECDKCDGETAVGPVQPMGSN